jgi:nitrate reductase NapAB chaperone NapD
MSIINSFNNSKEKFKPTDFFGKQKSSKYDCVIVVFSWRIIKALLEDKRITLIEDFTLSSSGGEGSKKFYHFIDHPNIIIYSTYVGASITVAYLEEVCELCSIKNIVMFGSCGVLDKNIAEGKIIVPIESFRDEGTSYHYKEASDYITIVNANRVYDILTSLNVDCIKGRVWTTDAIYRETEELIKRRKEDGCIAVDMELSAVEAFTQFRGYNLYNFMYGADNLDSTKWDPRILGKEHNQRLICLDLALEIAKVIISK